MKRPGPAGVTIVLAFAIVAAIEVRTLFAMFGIDIASQTYYALAAVVIVLTVAGLFALPKEETARLDST